MVLHSLWPQPKLLHARMRGGFSSRNEERHDRASITPFIDFRTKRVKWMKAGEFMKGVLSHLVFQMRRPLWGVVVGEIGCVRAEEKKPSSRRRLFPSLTYRPKEMRYSAQNRMSKTSPRRASCLLVVSASHEIFDCIFFCFRPRWLHRLTTYPNIEVSSNINRHCVCHESTRCL